MDWGETEATIQLFQNMVRLHIKLKGMTHATAWEQIFFPVDPLTLEVGSKGQNSTFSENGHVTYQVKGNDE